MQAKRKQKAHGGAKAPKQAKTGRTAAATVDARQTAQPVAEQGPESEQQEQHDIGASTDGNGEGAAAAPAAEVDPGVPCIQLQLIFLENTKTKQHLTRMILGSLGSVKYRMTSAWGAVRMPASLYRHVSSSRSA